MLFEYIIAYDLIFRLDKKIAGVDYEPAIFYTLYFRLTLAS